MSLLKRAHALNQRLAPKQATSVKTVRTFREISKLLEQSFMEGAQWARQLMSRDDEPPISASEWVEDYEQQVAKWEGKARKSCAGESWGWTEAAQAQAFLAAAKGGLSEAKVHQRRQGR
jgi:hypothetical protein